MGFQKYSSALLSVHVVFGDHFSCDVIFLPKIIYCSWLLFESSIAGFRLLIFILALRYDFIVSLSVGRWLVAAKFLESPVLTLKPSFLVLNH
jgi:hypothetical protein